MIHETYIRRKGNADHSIHYILSVSVSTLALDIRVATLEQKDLYMVNILEYEICNAMPSHRCGDDGSILTLLIVDIRVVIPNFFVIGCHRADDGRFALTLALVDIRVVIPNFFVIGCYRANDGRSALTLALVDVRVVIPFVVTRASIRVP